MSQVWSLTIGIEIDYLGYWQAMTVTTATNAFTADHRWSSSFWLVSLDDGLHPLARVRRDDDLLPLERLEED